MCLAFVSGAWMGMYEYMGGCVSVLIVQTHNTSSFNFMSAVEGGSYTPFESPLITGLQVIG